MWYKKELTVVSFTAVNFSERGPDSMGVIEI